VSVSIGGKAATLVYAGTAFRLVQGVLQVVAVVPAWLTGMVPGVLTVRTVASQTTATISLK